MLHKYISDEFILLYHIGRISSTHLGGEARDLIAFIDSLSIISSESLLDFYLRATKIQNELKVENDEHGNIHKITFRLYKLLFQQETYKSILFNTHRELLCASRRFNYHEQYLPYTIDKIYKTLKDLFYVDNRLVFRNLSTSFSSLRCS